MSVTAHRCYRLRLHKFTAAGERYGSKSYEGTLDTLLRLLKLRGFEEWTRCEQVAPGQYVIDGGAAELCVIDCVRGAGRERR